MFVGTPGVGKRVLVTLMSLWLAVKQQRDVLLFSNNGARTVLLGGQSGRYYVWNHLNFSPLQFARLLKHVENRGRVWVCADELSSIYRRVGLDLSSSMTTTAFPEDNMLELQRYLVPFWTQSDLKAVGQLHGWDADESQRRYAVSGGSLGLFLGGINDTKDYIDSCLLNPKPNDLIDLRMPRDGYEPVTQMPTVLDRSSKEHYASHDCWRPVVTSEYAKQRIGFCDVLRRILTEGYEEDKLAL